MVGVDIQRLEGWRKPLCLFRVGVGSGGKMNLKATT
jgi:hypothetical protein